MLGFVVELEKGGAVGLTNHATGYAEWKRLVNYKIADLLGGWLDGLRRVPLTSPTYHEPDRQRQNG